MTSARPWPLCRHDALCVDGFLAHAAQAAPAPTAALAPRPAAGDHLPRVAVLGRSGTPSAGCLRRWQRHGLVCQFLHVPTAPSTTWLQAVHALLGVRCVHLGPLKLDDPAWVAELVQTLRAHRIDAVVCASASIRRALWHQRDLLPAGLKIPPVRPAHRQAPGHCGAAA